MVVKHGVFDAREWLPFPGNGDNNTDTVFGGIHFNTTTLNHWNYTYFSNRTLSNGSECWLVFEPYEPQLLRTNGSFVNATSCYNAIDPIGTRGFTGIAFAVLFGLALVLTVTVLAKHGALYLPKGRRFYPIGRRWQWYWACFVCACALVSLFTNVDVDRYYLQELPIIVSVFFWFLTCQGTLALTWEAVRHWGSWQERQFVDPNPFVLRDDDKRSKIEFWLPLWFYFWVWMNFFMVVPRSWNFASYQRSPEQTAELAIPSATGVRFKVAAFMLLVAWLTIIFSLRHSIKHYKPRNRGVFGSAKGLIRALPLRLVLIIFLSLALIAYQIFISFVWQFSIIRFDGVVPVIFAWGYGPPLLILYIQITYGFASPNEDKELIRQRRERGDVINRELGFVQKPAWWRRVRGEHLGTMQDKIVRNVNEVGGERGVGRRVEDDVERHAREEAMRNALEDDGGIELSSIHLDDSSGNPRIDRAGAKAVPSSVPYTGKNERRHTERVMETAASVLFPSELGAQRAHHAAYLMELEDDMGPPPYTEQQRRESESGQPMMAHRTNSTSTTNSVHGPPQQVRSMLDI